MEPVRTRPNVVAPKKVAVPAVKKPVATIPGSLAKKVAVPAVKDEAKKVAEKVKKEKPVKEPKPPREQGATGYVIGLLVQHAYTDDEILAMVKEKYPDRSEKQIRVYISCQRGDVNSGRKKKWKEVAGKVIVPLVRDEKGNLIPKAELPKPEKPIVARKQKPKLAEVMGNDDSDENSEMPETHNSAK